MKLENASLHKVHDVGEEISLSQMQIMNNLKSKYVCVYIYVFTDF